MECFINQLSKRTGSVDQPLSTRTGQQTGKSEQPSVMKPNAQQILERLMDDKSVMITGARDLIHQARMACHNDPFSSSTIAKLSAYKLALGSYLGEVNLDYCDVIPTSVLCKNHTTPTLSRLAREVDETKGWIPWDFSLSKWMWGGMTSSDASEINKLFGQVQGKFTDMNNRFTNVQNNTISALSTLREELIDYSHQMSSKLASLTAASTNWGNDVATVLQQVSHNTSVTSMLTLGSLLLAQSGQVRDFIQDTINTVSLITQDTEDIFNAVLSGSIPLNQIPFTDMVETIQTINKQLPQGLQLVPVDKNNNLFETLVPSCYASPEGFLFYYTLPVITRAYDYKTWQVSSIPIDTGILNMQVSFDSAVVVVSDTHDHWYKLSDASYTSCTTNKARVCPFSPPHYSKSDPNCATALVMGSSKSRDYCHLVANPGTRLSDLAVLPIDGRRWLVSTPLSGLPSILRRKSNTSGLQEDKEEILRGLQMITLPSHCALKASDVALISYDNSMYHSISHIGSEIVNLPLLVRNPTLTSYRTTWLDKLNTTTVNLRRTLSNVSIPILELKMSGMSIHNVTELISGNSKILNETFDTDLRVHGFDQDDHLRFNIPGVIPMITLPISVTTFVITQITFDVLVIVLYIYKTCSFNIMQAIRNKPIGFKPYELDSFVQAVPTGYLNADHMQYNPFDKVVPTRATSTTSTTSKPSTTALPRTPDSTNSTAPVTFV